MRVEAAESGYVRARRRDVHPLLRDVAGYGRWWPGVTARPVGVAAALTLAAPRPWQRPQRVLAQVVKDRPDLGVTLSYVGDVRGEAEWYYLDEPAGVVVTYLLRAEVDDRGWRRRLAAHRARVRAGLFALADRADAGRPAGAEPDAALRADQAAAAAAFRAGVAAHAARSAGRQALGSAHDPRAQGADVADSVTDRIVIAADPDTIMDVIADVEAYPQWQDRVRSVEVLDTDDDGWATRARMVVDAKLFTASFVLAYDYTPDEMRWRLLEGDGLRRNDGAYRLRDLGDGSTEVTYELVVEPSLPVPGMLKREAARAIVDAALRGLRDRVEAGA